MKRIMSGILAFSLMFSFAVMPVLGQTPKMEKLVKSKEEELEIVKFLNQYEHLRYGGFDFSNPDKKVLGNFMVDLLARDPEILPHEKLVPEEEGDAQDCKYKEEDVNKKAMALFGVSLDFENYLVGCETEEGHVCIGPARDAPPFFTTHIKNMYALDGGLIYINIEVLNTWEFQQKERIENTLYQDLPASIQKGFYDKSPQNVIIKENIKNGKKSYELIRYTASKGPLTDKQLREYSRAQGPLILVNGKELEVGGVKKDDRVLVPLRAIFEALDAEVVYDGATKTITGTQGDTVVKLTVNKKEAMVGNDKILLDVPAQIINSSTLVPVRFIGESLGAEVVWEDNTVIINSKK